MIFSYSVVVATINWYSVNIYCMHIVDECGVMIDVERMVSNRQAT